MLMISCIFLLVSAQHHGGKSKNDVECMNDLFELNKSVEDLNPNINNREDLGKVQEKLSNFLQVLPNTLIKCMSTLNYDMSKPIEGFDPNFTFVHDCKSAYVELINQMRRIAKAYHESDIESISKSTAKLELVREKVLTYCADYKP